MISRLRIHSATGFDPYVNLATEKFLLDIVLPGECILYLWQNQNTVVIGRNQNPWLECRTELLAAEGGVLARRLSGGGAVFHDLGNLNFTFIMCKEDYDLDRQLAVIARACALAGIETERSGRNDILAGGRKFSGNAFYQSQGKAYHHGTLMVNVDKDRLGRYLSPPKAKLEAKGVASVRSRVVNLCELSPGLTVEAMKQYMAAAFCEIYGFDEKAAVFTSKKSCATALLAKEYASEKYLFGTTLPFTFQCEGRWDWGGVQLQLATKQGVITDAKLYSDAMDWSLAPAVEAALTGCRFALSDLQAALQAAPLAQEVISDLCRMLECHF